MPMAINSKWLPFLALIASLLVVACAGSDESDEVTLDLRIEHRALVGSESALEVKQDDVVTVNVTSDEPTSFHLHGYDHELEIQPHTTESFSFTADATGSFPITIHVGGDSLGADHHEKTIEAPDDLSVALEAEPNPVSGVNLTITTTGFSFEPDKVDQPHVAGEGHAHVYVDDVKIGRVYDSNYHLTEIDPGERSIRISLNANSHEQYAKGGHPVEATTTIVVPGEVEDESDHPDTDESHSEPEEIDLGRLEVLPR